MSDFDSHSNARTRPLHARLLPGAWVIVSGFAGAMLFGCATREVPARYPAESAASLAAEPAAPLVVTRSLSVDPPLPGENADGWEALDARPPASPSEVHHPHHGHQHATPEPPAPKPPHSHQGH